MNTIIGGCVSVSQSYQKVNSSIITLDLGVMKVLKCYNPKSFDLDMFVSRRNVNFPLSNWISLGPMVNKNSGNVYP